MSGGALNDQLIKRLAHRINLDRLADICEVDIIVAGGALLADKPHDYDVYAASCHSPLDFARLQDKLEAMGGWRRICSTKNAMTVEGPDGNTYQFCTYAKDDPDSLIRSFDFAHCQVGVVVKASAKHQKEAHFTEEFIRAMALEQTFFTGSDYPLASLARLVKYAQRGWYGKGRGYLPDILAILRDIVRRGYHDYDDFKDQLDAIDLSYSDNGSYDLWLAVRDRLCSKEG